MTEEQRLEASQRLRLAREKKMSRNDGVEDSDIGDGNDDDNDIDEFGWFLTLVNVKFQYNYCW